MRRSPTLGRTVSNSMKSQVLWKRKFNIMVPDYVVEKLDDRSGDAIASITEAGRATRPLFSTRNHFGIGSKVERA